MSPVLNTQRHWLAPPVFAGDEEKTRLARIANSISLAVIAILGVYTFARPTFFLENAEAAIANIILLVLLISQLYFIRRGWVRVAARTITTLAWINLTVQVWLFGGVRDAAFAAYLLIILVVSLMLSWRASFLFLLLSIITGLGMAHAEAVGVFPLQPDDPYALWLDHSLNFTIATILVTVMVTNLNQTLVRVRRNEKILTERNQELQAAKILLEAQIAERERTQQQLQRSEELFRQTVENSPNPIFSVDRTGRILTWNPACENLFQYDQQMIGGSYQDILWCPAESKAIEPLFKEVIEHARFLSGLEISYRCQDGTRRVMRSRLYPTLGQQGEVEACVFANTDITDRVQMEETLKQSEERHRLVVENANEAIVVAQDGQLKFFNSKLMEYTGCYSREEMATVPFTQFVHPDDRAMVFERHLKRLNGEECPQVYTFRVIDKNGRVTWVEINAIRISWEGKPAVLFFLNDITERKQAQDNLAESERRYRQLVKYAPAGIYEIDFLNSRFINVNDVMCDYSGYSREEFLSLSPLDLLTEDSRGKFMARTARVLAGEALPETAEFQVVTKSGQLLWVLVNTSVTCKNGQPARATVIAHDITERKQTEAELERYRVHLEELVEQRTAELTELNLHLQSEIAERKEAENRMRHIAGRQTLLYQVLRAISTRHEPDAVARMTVETIANITGWPHICFALPDEAGLHWVIQAADGELASEVGLTCAMNQGVIGRAFRTAQTQLVRDVRDDPDYTGENPLLLSELAVPIKLGSSVLAVLNFENTRPATFGPEEQQMAESLAEAIALALENARLFKNAQQEIFERKRAEATVKASLQEKEVLLKEIHHRVKNNLQVISSLLSLQANHIVDHKVLAALEDSQHRVRSMALIHQKLYQSTNLAQIDFGDYIRELAGYLFRAQSGHTRNISLNIQTDNVNLDLDMAVPGGLILNELISNCLKHAFPDGQGGEITVTCRAIEGGQIILTVGDDGVGLSAGLALENPGTLGLDLVKSLTEQLGGSLQVDTTQGVEFRLAFLSHNDKDLCKWINREF